MRSSIALVTAIALGLAACETGHSSTENLTGTKWVAETINGKPVIGSVTLTVSGDRVTGRSGCNTYFGDAEHKNGTLKIGTIGATKMACMKPGLMQQESEYLATLQASQTYAFQSDGSLVLNGPAGTLAFTR